MDNDSNLTAYDYHYFVRFSSRDAAKPDQATLINGVNYVSSDYIRIALLLMAVCCTAAVWVCTKKFNARNLLND